jgi:hypothetical protein
MRYKNCTLIAVSVILVCFSQSSATAQQSSQGAQAGQSDAVQDQYPHITELERSILNATFIGQPLSSRLSRMEQKAFGAPSSTPDLSDRTDALEQYAEQKLHKTFVGMTADQGSNGNGTYVEGDGSGAAAPPAVLSTGAGAADSASQTDYPRVTALENAILGQAYAGQPLGDRLSRMEVKAFGSPSTNSDFGDRTDALEKYADKKLHKKIEKELAPEETAGGGNTQPRSGMENIVSMIGRSLLGMAAGNVGGIGGVGPGAGLLPGFSGIRTHQKSQAQQQQEEQQSKAQQESRREDPAVYQKDPPPPDAKLLTKVGWCEVRVFGHTFQNMHLAQRLGQLNQELNFEPGKSDLELMDHINALMAAARTHPAAQAVVSAPSATK